MKKPVLNIDQSADKKNKKEIEKGQQPNNNTRAAIKSKTTDNYNPNNGPDHRSSKKKFK